jgi:uncharacterized protein YxeA
MEIYKKEKLMKRILITTTLIAFSISLIIFYARGADYFLDSSFKKQLKLAKQGDAFSQSIVGHLYLYGQNGARKNKKKLFTG